MSVTRQNYGRGRSRVGAIHLVHPDYDHGNYVSSCTACGRVADRVVSALSRVDPTCKACLRFIEKHGLSLPECAASMGCLCAGHARGNLASAPCDTSEEG